MSAKRPDWLINPSERMLVAGATGYGKTMNLLVQALYYPTAPVIFLNTKPDETIGIFIEERAPEHNALVESHSQLKKTLTNKSAEYIQIIPSASEMRDPEDVDEYLQLVYEYGRPALVIIDEVISVHKGILPGIGLINLLQRGRSKRMSVIAATQRPARISVSLLTEATKFIVYHLQNPDDRKKLAGYIAEFPIEKKLDKYEFLSYKVGDGSPILHSPIAPVVSHRQDAGEIRKGLKKF